MKNFKKLVAVLLAAVMALTMLAACSSEKSVLALLNEQGAGLQEDSSLSKEVNEIYDNIESIALKNLTDATARTVALGSYKKKIDDKYASEGGNKKFVYVSANSNAEAATKLLSQVKGYKKAYFISVSGKTVGVVSK